MFYLPNLRGDLLEENEPLLLRTSHLDQALTEAGTAAAASAEDPLDYLLAGWKRASKALRSIRSTDAVSYTHLTLPTIYSV